MANITSSVEKVSPKQAQVYLSYNYKYNRDMSAPHVKYYAEEMKKGRWSPSAPLYFCLVGKNTYLINGQHTLAAIIKSGTTQQLVVLRHVMESEEEVRDNFARIDRGRGRATRDSFQPFRIEQRLGLNKTMAGRLISAVHFIRAGFMQTGRAPTSVEDEMILLEDWQEPFSLIDECIIGQDHALRRKILNRAVLSVALLTAKYQPQKAREFWYQVMRDDGLSASDPRKLLRYKILVIKVTGGGAHPAPPFEIRSSRYLARLTATAWNAFFNGEERQVLRVQDERAAITIDGTPYDGKNNPT